MQRMVSSLFYCTTVTQKVTVRLLCAEIKIELLNWTKRVMFVMKFVLMATRSCRLEVGHAHETTVLERRRTAEKNN